MQVYDGRVLTEDQLQLIRSAARGASSSHDLTARLEHVDDPELSVRPAVLAFGFHFLTQTDTEARDRRSGPWGPMVELNGHQFPPHLESIDEHVVNVWQQMVEAIDAPSVQARCGDLLWVRKYGSRPDQAARACIQGYLALAANEDWSVMERTEGLARSLEIARELRDDQLAADVASSLSAAADREMSSDERRPGVTLRLLQPLVTLPAELRPDGLLEQFVAAQALYGSDPYIAQAASESIAQLSAPEMRRGIDQRVVRRWIEEAGKGDALMRIIRLQQALELALASGLGDEADEVRVLMAAVDADDLELKRVEAEVVLPRAPVDAFCEHVSTLELPDALRAFGAQGPPTGRPTEAERATAEGLRESPLLGLIPRVVLGESYPTPIFVADTPERRQRLEVAQHRARSAQIWGVAAASILDAISAGHAPSKEDLETALTTSLLSPDLRERIARAFELHFEGEYDECVHLLAPRLEAALRSTADAAGVPVIIPPRGEEPGGVVSLGEILNSLQGRFDEGWRLYLTTVLTDRLALNLRNAVSHGTRSSFGVTDAALLLHVACFLVGLHVENAPSRPPE